MSLKKTFLSFLRTELDIPLAGVAPPDDYTPDDLKRLQAFIDTFSQRTPLPETMKNIVHPRQVLDTLRSIIIVAAPTYIQRALKFGQCRDKLLGTVSALHVSAHMMERSRRHSKAVCSFFTDRGFICRPIAGPPLLPLKIMAARCGIGYYGKNSMILHPDFGSWLSITAFGTDAPLEPDDPLEGTCGECMRCVKACPTGALNTPYQCDAVNCINYLLGSGKNFVPREFRPTCKNLLNAACTACKDVCPHNKKLTQIPGFVTPNSLLNPPLLDILEMTEQQWDATFGPTRLGLIMKDKKYLQRNAVIGLGNFGDDRAVKPLAHQLARGENGIREYAAWALGRIATSEACSHLEAALAEESAPLVRQEITAALGLSET